MAKKTYVLVLGLSFIAGTFFAGLSFPFFKVFSWFLVLSLGFIFLKRREEGLKKNFRAFRWIIFLGGLFLLLGFFYFHLFLNLRNENSGVPIGKEIYLLGEIKTDPLRTDTYQLFEIESRTSYQGRIKIFSRPFPRFEYGDVIRVSGILKESKYKNDWPVAFYPEVEVVSEGGGFWLKQKLVSFKNFLVSNFALYLSKDQAALLAGLTFGERGDFSPNFKEDMNLAGVTHVVALSGYNIAILALAIERAFSRFFSRKKRFYLTLGVILFFVLMVGGEASVVRAAIMGGLALLAQYLGRPHDVIHLIVITATGMILIDPTIAGFDVGFQLSFLSLLGIIFIESALRKIFRLKDNKEGSFLAWKENGLTTISAQMAVLPVLIINFDYFSPISVLANILVLFAVPFAMFLGFLLAGFMAISQVLGFLVAKLAAIVLGYQILIIKIFSVEGFSFGRIQEPFLFFVIFYGILGVIVLYSRKYEKIK